MFKALMVLVLAGAALVAPGSVSAQGSAAVRVLDEDRLFRESRFGQTLMAEVLRLEAEIERENEVLAEQLAEEERALTEARAQLSPEEFRARADAFDQRVEAIRAERTGRLQDLARETDAATQRFFERALPIIGETMEEQGVVALLRRDAVIVGAEWLDITPLVLQRLDAALGNAAP
jgi:Skp family chaperone for outer membrane proteins